ncbi:unnamed protein product, partial [Polarella glacialis]
GAVREVTQAIAELGRRGLWQEAVHQLFVETRSPTGGCSAAPFNAALGACGRSAQWEVGAQLLGAMCFSRLMPDAISFGAAVIACEKGMQWGQALQVLLEAKRRLQRPWCPPRAEEKDPPQVLSQGVFGAALSACMRGQRWDQALQLLPDLGAAGLRLNVITLSVAMSGCERAEQWQQSLELLLSARRRQLEPDLVPLVVAVSALGRGQHWEAAVGMLSEMRWRAVEPNVVALNSAVTASSRAPGQRSPKALGGPWQWSLEAFLRGAAGWRLQSDIVTRNAALAACKSSGHWEAALELLTSCSRRGQVSAHSRPH